MFSKIRNNKMLVIAVLMLLDVLIITACGAAALLARYDLHIDRIPREYASIWLNWLPFECVITLTIFALLKMYRFVWHNVGLYDVLLMIGSTFAAFLVSYLCCRFLVERLPISVCFIKLVLELFLVLLMRCSVRLFSELEARRRKRDRTGERIMVVGAGDAGHMLIREIENSGRTNGRVCCIMDDNPNKWGKYIEGIRVAGGRDAIPTACKKYKISQIILAMPAVPKAQQDAILEICKRTGCRVRRVPGMYQLVNGEITMDSVRDVQPEDLLGRDSVQLDTSALYDFLSHKSVMVTGGGGSIGSELCRQIAKYNPRELIVLDIYENNAYDIQQELRQKYGAALNLRVEIASVRDKDKVYQIFERCRPDIVFHAAAHKHVPLMEHNPEEAVKNNVFGTYHVVRAAEKFGTQKFVMISTDKAVNPTNFMGATKRFCEMFLQSRFDSPTEYCAVRFGNVLGSNGSVVPLFKRQIAEGGPVTITDKRIIRYFMTIPEAAQLVLEAGAMAHQSQIFVLDMGEPVRILDLAENLIRLSGLEPYIDIEIKEVGLRPGEKLYEELLIASNDLDKTENNKIFIEQQKEISRDEIMENLQLLDQAISSHIPTDELVALMHKIVPTYKEPKAVNDAAIASRLIGESTKE